MTAFELDPVTGFSEISLEHSDGPIDFALPGTLPVPIDAVIGVFTKNKDPALPDPTYFTVTDSAAGLGRIDGSQVAVGDVFTVYFRAEEIPKSVFTTFPLTVTIVCTLGAVTIQMETKEITYDMGLLNGGQLVTALPGYSTVPSKCDPFVVLDPADFTVETTIPSVLSMG